MSGVVTYDRPPALLPSMFRGLLQPRPGVPAPSDGLPQTELHWQPARFDPARLAAYRGLCGFDSGDAVPITYPLVASFPLQLALLTRREWPLRPLGLVHLGVNLVRHRPLAVDGDYDVRCRAGAAEYTARGLEFELLVSVADAAGMMVWEGSSRVLYRQRNLGPRGERLREPEPASMATVGVVDAPKDIGWSYARVAGDWNPIHLGRIGARAFGFPRPVAHGMWTLARSLVLLGNRCGGLDMRFQLPFYLPGRMTLLAGPGHDGKREFVGRNDESGAFHLAGTVQTESN